MSRPAEKPQLVIKDNNTSVRENCALCGMSDKASIGPSIFVEGTWNFVCDGCAQRETPTLFEAVMLWRREEELRQYPSYCNGCGKVNKLWWDDQLQADVCGHCGTVKQNAGVDGILDFDMPLPKSLGGENPFTNEPPPGLLNTIQSGDDLDPDVWGDALP